MSDYQCVREYLQLVRGLTSILRCDKSYTYNLFIYLYLYIQNQNKKDGETEKPTPKKHTRNIVIRLGYRNHLSYMSVSKKIGYPKMDG